MGASDYAGVERARCLPIRSREEMMTIPATCRDMEQKCEEAQRGWQENKAID